IATLVKRIDDEFSGLKDRIKHAQGEQLHEYQQRQERLIAFDKQLAELTSIWKPRLEALVKRFGDQVTLTPQLSTAGREAKLEFQSNLAQIRLRLSASTDRDVRKLVLDYSLEILPILMEFEAHKHAEWPLESVDREAVAN